MPIKKEQSVDFINTRIKNGLRRDLNNISLTGINNLTLLIQNAMDILLSTKMCCYLKDYGQMEGIIPYKNYVPQDTINLLIILETTIPASTFNFINFFFCDLYRSDLFNLFYGPYIESRITTNIQIILSYICFEEVEIKEDYLTIMNWCYLEKI